MNSIVVKRVEPDSVIERQSVNYLRGPALQKQDTNGSKESAKSRFSIRSGIFDFIKRGVCCCSNDDFSRGRATKRTKSQYRIQKTQAQDKFETRDPLVLNKLQTLNSDSSKRPSGFIVRRRINTIGKSEG